MAHNTTLTIPDAIMEQWHCSICDGYLSCSPVRVLADGTCICGQCFPPTPDTLVSRVLALEAVLSSTSFPCRFKQFGCTERLPFGQSIEHESRCAYRVFPCPSSQPACLWEGSRAQMLDHFTEKHSDLVVQKADFKLEVDRNSEGIFAVVENGIGVFVRYLYATSDCDLKYNVRFCVNNSVLNASYKLQLINDADPEYNINLKTTNGCVFNASFYDVQNAPVLNLNKFVECLDGPKCVAVSMKFKVEVDDCRNENKNDATTNDRDSQKCGKSYKDPVPALYELDGGIDCAEMPVTNTNVPLTELELQCRWQDCKVVAKSDSLREHELKCPFKKHKCLFDGCGFTFTLAKGIAHYKQVHKAGRFTEEYVFKMSFLHNNYFKRVFTIKHNAVVLFQYKIVNYSKIFLRLYSSEPNKITGVMNFEHHHCKFETIPCPLTCEKEFCINLRDFPSCVKASDIFTVTFKIL